MLTPDLLRLACDLTSGLGAEDRYRRLIATVERVIPCEAVALLRLDGDALVPLAFSGLVPDLAGRRFVPRDHPRLGVILNHRAASGDALPVRFAPDSTLPDPYDGLMLADPHACARVHACMGCALVVGDTVIGALTVDSRDPSAFAKLEDSTIATLAALAAASIHTAGLIDALERTSRHRDTVLRHLVQDDRERRGGQLLGTSPAMQALRHEIDVVASSDLPVLITGETGVGKELVANAIHAASRRSNEPLVQVNCAALPEALAESELFGHLRGAFTGATQDRAGTFEIADGGTLFLDEIGELPLLIQAKLLRALQQGEIQRIGADRVLQCDVRIIAATNRDLEAAQISGRFRSDLFHRLAVYPLRIPPLRERREDLPLLAGHVLEREAQRLGCGPARLDASARSALDAYPWPGNVRELEHVLMRALVRTAGAVGRQRDMVIGTSDLGLGTDLAPRPMASPAKLAQGRSLREQMDAVARTHIAEVLARHAGNWTAAARELVVTPGNLQRLATRLGLRPAAKPAAVPRR